MVSDERGEIEMKTGIKTTELKAMIVDKQLDDKFQKLYMDTVDL